MYRLRLALPQDMAAVRVLFRSYADSLDFNLDFQNFDQELAALPGPYAPPGGRILLAEQLRNNRPKPVGCVALKPLAPAVCEMKRLYVLPARQGLGLGRTLAQAVIQEARKLGYERMLLDTVTTMARAVALYESLGFVPAAPYCPNPLPGARFYELAL